MSAIPAVLAMSAIPVVPAMLFAGYRFPIGSMSIFTGVPQIRSTS